MDITTGLYNKLKDDGTLVALLASYPSGSPDGGAIFTAWPVPPDAERPYVYTRGDVAVTHFDEIHTNLGLDVIRDIFVVDDNTGSELAVEAIARRIRTLLHRQPLTIPDGSHIMTQCIGQTVAETDDSLTGRVLTFRIVAMES